MLGGVVTGLLTVLGDFLDVFGSSGMILISVSVALGYYDKLVIGKKNSEFDD